LPTYTITTAWLWGFNAFAPHVCKMGDALSSSHSLTLFFGLSPKETNEGNCLQTILCSFYLLGPPGNSLFDHVQGRDTEDHFQSSEEIDEKYSPLLGYSTKNESAWCHTLNKFWQQGKRWAQVLHRVVPLPEFSPYHLANCSE